MTRYRPEERTDFDIADFHKESVLTAKRILLKNGSLIPTVLASKNKQIAIYVLAGKGGGSEIAQTLRLIEATKPDAISIANEAWLKVAKKDTPTYNYGDLEKDPKHKEAIVVNTTDTKKHSLNYLGEMVRDSNGKLIEIKDTISNADMHGGLVPTL